VAKAKKKSDLNKRLAGGFFVLSVYVLTYYSGILYQQLFSLYIMY
jgi:hypothetical protein